MAGDQYRRFFCLKVIFVVVFTGGAVRVLSQENTTEAADAPTDDFDGSSSSESSDENEDYDSFSRNMEQDLRLRIFNPLTYDKLIRPQGVVHVHVSLRLKRVNTLDIEEQTMTLTAFMFVTWKDERLEWTNYSRSDIAGVQLSRSIPNIFTSERYTWLPPINIENSVMDMSIISDPDVPMRIRHTGQVEWNPASIFAIQCYCDVTFYPFDTQVCSLIISTRAYTKSEILLHFSRTPLKLQSYQQNGEWDLLNYSVEEKVSSTEMDQADYSSLHIKLTMRRRPLYLFMNTIIPTVLLSFLSALVFKLPADSGEKIGYSLTVLLSYAVYLTVISSRIPAAALTISILSVYTVIVLIMGVVAVILSIVVLDCYHRHPDEEVTGWIRSCVLGCLISLSGWKQPDQRMRGKISRVGVAPWDGGDSKLDDVFMCDGDQKKVGQESACQTGEPEDGPKPVPRKAWLDKNLSWRDISRMLDSFFLRLYICVLFAITGFVAILFSFGYFGV